MHFQGNTQYGSKRVFAVSSAIKGIAELTLTRSLRDFEHFGHRARFSKAPEEHDEY